MTDRLVTVPNVELAEVGRWLTSTGVWECTAEDLAAAVEAYSDPGIRTPIVKIGHTDPRFDGQPAVGQVQNLRLSADRMKLVGDLVGIPAWLAEVLPSAYPSRSVEALKNYRGSTGHRHRVVLTGVALLGVEVPAIETLDDVRRLYEPDVVQLDIAAAAAAADGAERVTYRPGGSMPTQRIAASVNIDDVRGAYYEQQPAGSWAWVREVWTDFLIVDDDEGGLWRVPWSLGDPDQDGDQDVVFGQPTRVRVEYVDVAADVEQPALLSRSPIRASRALREKAAQVRAGKSSPRPPAGSPPSKGAGMDPVKLREALGLPADASDIEVQAKLAAANLLKPADEKPPAEPKAEEKPAGEEPPPDADVVTIDRATWDETRLAASQGRQAFERQRATDRDQLIEQAIQAGKFPPARRDHWRALYDADPDGTRDLVAKLQPGLVPLEAKGHESDGVPPEGDALIAELGRLGSSIFAEKETTR